MKRWVVLLLLAAACGGSASDHELLGDAAYVEGDYPTALREYQAAAKSRDEAKVWAKLGAAALKAGELREAASAYQKLAAADKTRASEAARGLEQVAAAAAGKDGGDIPLREAVEGLRRLAPERVRPRHTMALVRSANLEPTEVAALGPLALAAASDAAATDQMLVQYGAALQATTACGDAIELFQVALRRTRDPSIRTRATKGVSECGLQLGREAMLVDRPEIATQWFTRVLTVDSTSDRGRLALVGLGDARMAQGDLLGATIVFQDAMKADPNDSVSALASQRLARLGATAGSADSQ
ncbi:MAG TPA: tetratricopeptide repeat protein [Gemmatimonadales bacterium]|nr:tetratricopeptide repeat protein [Gemmatimonadales bacterium]